MNLQESGEMYLETILVLSKKNKDVRSIDIARELNYSKPSVSRAIGLLKKDEYIIVDSKGYIELTDKGAEVANTIYDRHDTLSSFFESLLEILFNSPFKENPYNSDVRSIFSTYTSHLSFCCKSSFFLSSISFKTSLYFTTIS